MRTSRGALVALALVGAVVGSSCSWASGDAQAERFAQWYADHPVADVRIEAAEGEDVLPLVGGAVEVRARLTRSEPRPPDLERAMTGLCGFEEVADGSAEVTYVLLVGVAELLFSCVAGGPEEMASLWEALPAGPEVTEVSVRPTGAVLATEGVDPVTPVRRLLAALARTEWGPRLPVRAAGDGLDLDLAGSEGADRVLEAVELLLDRPAGVRRGDVRATSERVEVATTLDPDEARELARQVRSGLAGEPGEGGGAIGAPSVVVLPRKVEGLGVAPDELPVEQQQLVDRLVEDPAVTSLRLDVGGLRLSVTTTEEARRLLGEVATSRGVRDLETVGLAVTSGTQADRCAARWQTGAGLDLPLLALDLCEVAGVVAVADDRVRGLQVDVGEGGLDEVVAVVRDAPWGTRVVLTRTGATSRASVRLTVEDDRPRFDDPPGDEALARAVAAAWD